MSQWEEVTLEDATHVEMGGKVHELGIRPNSKHQVVKYDKYSIDVYMESGNWQRIQTPAFSVLGIRCLRKVKPTPIEFEARFAKYDGRWHPLYCSADGFAYQNCKKAKFKCVEILEEEE